MTPFKPRVGKVISGQTTGGFSVITPKINISHILIKAHGFKVYRTKTLCKKNYCIILKKLLHNFEIPRKKFL